MELRTGATPSEIRTSIGANRVGGGGVEDSRAKYERTKNGNGNENVETILNGRRNRLMWRDGDAHGCKKGEGNRIGIW